MRNLAAFLFIVPFLIVGCSKEPEIVALPIEGTYVGVRNADDVFELVNGQYKQGSGPDLFVGTYTSVNKVIPGVFEVNVIITQPEQYRGLMTLTMEERDDGTLSVTTQQTNKKSFYKKL